MKTKHYLTLFIIFFSLTNCSEQEVVIPKTSLYTGKELFEGFVFLEENIIDQLPRTKNMLPDVDNLLTTEEEKEVFNVIKTILVESIEQNDPSFFDSFQLRMQSGDHLLIHQALADANEVLIKAIHTKFASELVLTAEEEEALLQIDASQFYNEDGSINEQEFVSFIQKSYASNRSRTNVSNQGQCLTIPVVIAAVFAAAYAVIIAGAIAVIGGIAIELALAAQAAIAYDLAVMNTRVFSGGTSMNGGSQDVRPEQYRVDTGGSKNLAQDIMIHEIATKLSLLQ